MNVMVVDDDPAIAANLSRGLHALGWSACVAHSSAEALSLLRATPEVAVMVTDIRMPDGSGLDLAEAVKKARTDEQATEVIIMTGHAGAADMAAAMRLGVCDVLHKPFRLRELADAIQEAAARSKARRDAARARRKEVLAVDSLADELAMLRERLKRMQDAAAKNGARTEVDWNKANSALSHALRSPLLEIVRGAGAVGQEAPNGLRHEDLELLRGGVQHAVTSIELLEEFIRPPRQDAAAVEPLDVASLVATVARTASAWSGVELHPGQSGNAERFAISAVRQNVWRAVTLCFEAALEWGGAGCRITYGLETVRSPHRACVCLTIAIVRDDEAGLTATRPGFGDPAAQRSETVESLRFLIAQRLAANFAGTLTSSQDGEATAEICLTLPLVAGA